MNEKKKPSSSNFLLYLAVSAVSGIMTAILACLIMSTFSDNEMAILIVSGAVFLATLVVTFISIVVCAVGAAADHH